MSVLGADIEEVSALSIHREPDIQMESDVRSHLQV